MKKNFIISDIEKIRIEKAEELFIVDPFVHYLLLSNNEDGNYKNIESAEFLRTNRKLMDEAVDFTEEKYQKYIPILAKRLNKIHGTTYSEFFWKKSLSTAFKRYITLFHDVFAKCEKYFDPEEHICQILSKESFYTPLDFEEHRTVFQATLFGQEQIFSHYINLFYPNMFKTIDLNPKDFGCNFIKTMPEYKSKFKIKNKFKLIKYRILSIFSKKYQKKFMLKNLKNTRIGVLGSFFSQENFEKLINKSNGKIKNIDNVFYVNNIQNTPINHKKRYMLSEFEDDFDKFDKFFFSTLPYCMPKVFIENFDEIYNSVIKNLKKYPEMKYVISEAWLSDTYISMSLATMKERGIKHIYNEHNCIFYPFTGHMIENMSELVDYYVSFGWESDTLTNFVSGASLFPFSINKTFEKNYNILYVSYCFESKMPTYGGAYGVSEVNVSKQLKFIKSFMQNLKIETLQNMHYRGYPKNYEIKYLPYDKEKYLKEYIQYTKILPSRYENGETCKEQMLKSRLVIIDYISTAYLEALSMNIPVVFFFDPNITYLKDEFKDFYKILIDVGICQTDPIKASEFIETIKDNPEEWWKKEEVQNAKNEFLSKNFKHPQVMIDYLLNLAES